MERGQEYQNIFVENIKAYQNSMFRLAKSIVRNDTDAEDAVASATLKAFEKIHSLRSWESFKPWIMTIAANESYTILRQKKRIELTEHMEAFDGPVAMEEVGELWSVVMKLPEDYRAVIVLFYYDDMGILQIAKILNLSVGTVKSRLSRGRKKLRVLVEQEGGFVNEPI